MLDRLFGSPSAENSDATSVDMQQPHEETSRPDSQWIDFSSAQFIPPLVLHQMPVRPPVCVRLCRCWVGWPVGGQTKMRTDRQTD